MANLFFSYSHRDSDLRDELEIHLAALKRDGVIETWHDRKIGAGKEFDNDISQHLEEADIILLLISPYFIASDYCYEIEMKRAMERHQKGEARVIPIILEPCDWQKLPFRKLIVTPTDGKPISKFPNKHDGFLEVTRAIRKAVEDLGGPVQKRTSENVRDAEKEPANHSILGWLSAGLLGAIVAGFLLVMWWAPGKENAELKTPSGSSVKDKPSERGPGPQVKMGDKGEQRSPTAPTGISETTTAKSQPEPKPFTKSLPQVGATGPHAGAPAEAPRDETSVAERAPATTNQPTASTRSLPPAQETYVSPAQKAFRDVGQFRFEVESVRASKNTNDVAVILNITNKSSRDVALALGANPYQSIFLMDDRGYRYAYRNASGIGAWKGPAFMPTPSDWLAITPFESRTVSLTFGSGSRITVDSSSKFVLSAELAVAPPDDTRKGTIRPSIMNLSIQEIKPQ